MRIEMEQIISIEDITDPANNPAAAWLYGNHTKVIWTEPNKNGNFWPVRIFDACSHESSIGPIFILFENDLPWLEREDSKLASLILERAEKNTNTP